MAKYDPIPDLNVGVPELVSILIPTYKPLLFIERCIESIFEHTNYANYEVCIADDASPTTDHIEYLKTLARTNRVKVVFGNERLGHGPNTMRAFEQSKGQFVLLLNDDCHIPFENRSWLDYLVNALKQNPTWASVTPALLHGLQHRTIYWIGKKRPENCKKSTHDFLHHPWGHESLPTAPVDSCYNNFACCLTWRGLLLDYPIGTIHKHYGSDSEWCNKIQNKFGLLHMALPLLYVYHENAFGAR